MSSQQQQRRQHKDSQNGVVTTPQTSILAVPVTVARKPYVPSEHDDLAELGVARANIAVSTDAPHGTPGWAEQHRDKTVLQQHCEFFDRDNDGIVWPQDTFVGFRAVRFGVVLSVLAAIVVHVNFSYPTVEGFFPDPFFRLWVGNVHKAKHGSDSGTYDHEGRYVPQRFEDFFSEYGSVKDGLTAHDLWNALKGQRCVMDPIGWGGAVFEWSVTYQMIWPADGILRKEEVRRVLDGSIFQEYAEKHSHRGSHTTHVKQV